MKNMQLRMLIIATTTTTTADESEAMMNDERNILRRFEFDAKMTEITRERESFFKYFTTLLEWMMQRVESSANECMFIFRKIKLLHIKNWELSHLQCSRHANNSIATFCYFFIIKKLFALKFITTSQDLLLKISPTP